MDKDELAQRLMETFLVEVDEHVRALRGGPRRAAWARAAGLAVRVFKVDLPHQPARVRRRRGRHQRDARAHF